MPTIYKVSSILDGKVVYVGQTSMSLNKRWSKSGYKHCLPWADKKKFIASKIISCGHQDTADEIERLYIKEYDTINNGYNKASGGKYGYKQGAYFTSVVSSFRKGKKNSEEAIKKTRKTKNIRKVQCIETGCIYDSSECLSKAIKYDRATIYRHLSGIGYNKTIRGKTYKYLIEEK